MKPTIGRIVHFVSNNEPGKHQPAIVSDVRYFETQTEPEVDLHIFHPFGVMAMRGITHSEEPKVGGTWHWPEREG